MTLTTAIVVNAVLDVLVVVALFRLMWFGVSARYPAVGSAGEHELQREDAGSRRAAEHERHAA